MSGLFSFLKRIRNINSPPNVPAKNADALRFGILGAARIAPNALIIPAISHPDVVVLAVASRDASKASAYAKKHRISKVYSGDDCYQAVLDDPDIDVVYIPLPNGLHYEWTMRALSSGKHVLVEKPMADTPQEAQQMIELAASKNLVLLEAIHYTFHPATHRVKELLDSGELGKITGIRADFAVPDAPHGIFFLKDDVRFKYDLGGGATMDMGVYPLSAVRFFTASEPVKVSSAHAVGHAADPARIDREMTARLMLQSSIEAETYADFGMSGWGPFHIFPRLLKASVHVECERGALEYFNYPLAHVFHSIKIKPQGGKERVEKAYRFADGRGQDWWSSYRYQLEAFVEQVRGRTPHYWPEADDPVRQLQWVEGIYAAADMPARPASELYSPSHDFAV